MKTNISPGQLLLLLVLLATGVGMIWHIGHNLLPPAATDSQVRQAAREPVAGQQAQAHPAPNHGVRAPDVAKIPAPMAGGAAAEQARAKPREQTVAPPPVPRKDAAQPPAAVQRGSTPAPAPPALPTEPQSRGTSPRPVLNEQRRFISTAPILFNTGFATLRSESNIALDKLADLLKEKPEIRLEIIGHTDNLGDESTNQRLSADRAAAVEDYLVSRGIDQSRLESKGMGSISPIASNDTRLGRQANRRIEFLVTSPK